MCYVENKENSQCDMVHVSSVPDAGQAQLAYFLLVIDIEQT